MYNYNATVKCNGIRFCYKELRHENEIKYKERERVKQVKAERDLHDMRQVRLQLLFTHVFFNIVEEFSRCITIII